jgi:hypothetical protein
VAAPSAQTLLRIASDTEAEQNNEWADSRRYLSLESLAPVSDDPLLGLPAVAA